MSQQTRLDVLRLQRFLQQRIIQQIDLTDRQIVGGAPVTVHQVQVVGICQLIVRSCRCHPDFSGPGLHINQIEGRSIRPLQAKDPHRCWC